MAIRYAKIIGHVHDHTMSKSKFEVYAQRRHILCMSEDFFGKLEADDSWLGSRLTVVNNSCLQPFWPGIKLDFVMEIKDPVHFSEPFSGPYNDIPRLSYPLPLLLQFDDALLKTAVRKYQEKGLPCSEILNCWKLMSTTVALCNLKW